MSTTLSPREMEALVAAEEIDIVDVREPNEYATGHVPGALHDAAEMTRAEFEGVEAQSRKLVNTWVFLLYAIGGCFYLYILYRYFYPELVLRIVPDTENLP